MYLGKGIVLGTAIMLLGVLACSQRDTDDNNRASQSTSGGAQTVTDVEFERFRAVRSPFLPLEDQALLATKALTGEQLRRLFDDYERDERRRYAVKAVLQSAEHSRAEVVAWLLRLAEHPDANVRGFTMYFLGTLAKAAEDTRRPLPEFEAVVAALTRATKDDAFFTYGGALPDTVSNAAQGALAGFGRAPRPGGQPSSTEPKWRELVETAATLKARSRHVPKFRQLRALMGEPGDDPSKVTSIAGTEPQLATAFVRFHREGKRPLNPNAGDAEMRKAFKAYDDAANAFSTQLRSSTTCDDLPFLAYLANLQISGAVESATLGRIEKCLIEDRNAALGLVLVAIEEAVGPWGIERFARLAASSGDERSLPDLVKWYIMHPMYTREPVVKAIAKIDPNQRVLAGYFAWTESFVRGEYVPAEAKSSRSLRKELTRTR